MSNAERNRNPPQFQIAGLERHTGQNRRRQQMDVDVSNTLSVDSVTLDEAQDLGVTGHHDGWQILQ
jgi:hypothetical protein